MTIADPDRAPALQLPPGTPVEVPLHWSVSAHARRLLYLALAGLVVAVVARRPEFVGVAAPALVLLCAGRGPRPGTVRVTVRLSARRIYEGEQVALHLSVQGHEDHSVELLVHPADGMQAVRGADRAAAGTATLALEAERWGRRRLGLLEMVVWDRHRMFECHEFLVLPEISCYPRPAQHRRAVVLGRLASRSGDHTARAPGEGSEFFGVRQYVAGDRQRSINWAATTRRGRLQVNTFAAERSQDLVLVVDGTTDVGKAGSTPVDFALRGALGVARTYLDARDRVGLVFFGGQVLWVAPGMGQRQFYRLIETMLEGRTGWSSGEEVKRLPRAALPSGASVVAFSPLLDTPFVEALRDLRQRSFPVVVVDVLNSEPQATKASRDRLAQRIWRMERQALRFSLGELGIGVVRWAGEGAITLPVEQRGHRAPRAMRAR